MHDGEVAATGASASETLASSIAAMLKDQAHGPFELVTLYWGEDGSEWEATAAAAMIQQHHPEVQVQVVHGGQPHYHYVASLE